MRLSLSINNNRLIILIEIKNQLEFLYFVEFSHQWNAILCFVVNETESLPLFVLSFLYWLLEYILDHLADMFCSDLKKKIVSQEKVEKKNENSSKQIEFESQWIKKTEKFSPQKNQNGSNNH